jgi:hypothetical protein
MGETGIKTKLRNEGEEWREYVQNLNSDQVVRNVEILQCLGLKLELERKKCGGCWKRAEIYWIAKQI